MGEREIDEDDDRQAEQSRPHCGRQVTGSLADGGQKIGHRASSAARMGAIVTDEAQVIARGGRYFGCDPI